MTCEQMNDLVHAYLDGELSLTEQSSVAEHLGNCQNCEQAHRTFAGLRGNLQNDELRFKAPFALRTKLRDSIAAERVERPNDSRPTLVRQNYAWPRFLAAAAMFAILVGGAILILSGRNEQRGYQLALVDAHVRSLQANHLMDVISTDQHTVKPWFDGKVDFAPPVHDEKDQGFPLIGGRLDYINGKSAAALIYQRNKHLINIFVQPEPGADQSPTTTSINGYQLIEWRSAGMRETAVSDLNAAELRQLVDLLH